jgi:PAS domain S-box-containing protein
MKRAKSIKLDEKIYKILFNHANDAIFLMHKDRFIECNPKTLEIFNCSKSEIIGATPYDKFSPEIQPDGTNSKDKALEKIMLAYKGVPLFFEWVHKKADGSLFDSEVSLNRIKQNNKYFLIAIVRDVSERKKLQQELQASINKYYSIYDTAPLAFLISDWNSRIIGWNHQAEKTFGWKADEIMNKNFYDILVPNFALNHVKNVFEKLKRGEKFVHSINANLTKDGNIITCEWFNTSYIDENNNLNFLSLSLDITDKIKTQSELELNYKRFKLLHELDKAILEKWAAKEYAEIVVSNLRKILDCDYISFAFIDTKKNEAKIIAASPNKHFLLKEGAAISFNEFFQSKRKENKIIYINNLKEKGINQPIIKHLINTGYRSCIIMPICIDNKLYGYLNLASVKENFFDAHAVQIIQEVADIFAIAIQQNQLYEELKNYSLNLEKLVEQRTAELSESEKKYKMIVETPLVAIYIADETSTINFVNDRFLKLTNYSAEEVINKMKMIEFVAEKDKEFAFDRIRRRHKEYLAPDLIEITLLKKDGKEFTALLAPAGIYDNNGKLKGYLGALIDISDRKKLEEKLIEVNKELEAFTFSVSHDLKAPLRAMQGFAIALLEDYSNKLDETADEYLRRIVFASQKMDSLINDLLHYSRLSRMEIKLIPVDIKAVLQGVIANLYSEIESKNAKIEVASEIPIVCADQILLSQVLQNLISNAIKFSKKDTKPIIKIWAQEKNDYVRINVEDNGIGIKKEYHKKIFNIFERLHGVEIYPGSGIGLAIVKRAIERMNGIIGVESEEGCGSIFWFELPKSKEA